MEAIKITVTGAQALVTNAPVVTCGMVGLPVEVVFDEAWEGLEKTLVYRAGSVTRIQTGITDGGIVAREVLLQAGHTLRIGVYGTSPDGVVIPTVWASAGMIRRGVDPEADPALEPQAPAWANALKKPKLLWELRVPGRAQGFTGYQQWDAELKRFLSVDIYWKPVPWNKEWWRDPQLPADTNLYDIFMELFACLEGKIPVYMEFELNGSIYTGGYPTLTRFQAAEDNEICKLMICAPDSTIPMTTYSDLTVLEATPHGLNCSFAVGEVAQENGWAVRVYGLEV